MFVDQNVGHALSGELGGSDGEHIGPTTETVGDEQDVTSEVGEKQLYYSQSRDGI